MTWVQLEAKKAGLPEHFRGGGSRLHPVNFAGHLAGKGFMPLLYACLVIMYDVYIEGIECGTLLIVTDIDSYVF